MRWIVGAQTHGMWLGSYEWRKQAAIFKCLRPGQTFFDIGANTGYFSLLGSRSVGASGRVVAVEPLPRNIEFLERHLAMNGISNVHVVGKAISDYRGTARFCVDGHSTSRFSDSGRMLVQVTTLDDLVKELGCPPDVMKVDIEGAEMELLRGAKQVLENDRPVIFLALHSKDNFERLIVDAPAWRYAIRGLDGGVLGAGRFQEEVVLLPVEFQA
jgi:FkbM family methyltransferase